MGCIKISTNTFAGAYETLLGLKNIQAKINFLCSLITLLLGQILVTTPDSKVKYKTCNSNLKKT